MIQRVAQTLDDTGVVERDKARFQRNALHVKCLRPIQKIPHTQTLSGVALQALIPLAKIAVVAVGVNGKLHDRTDQEGEPTTDQPA